MFRLRPRKKMAQLMAESDVELYEMWQSSSGDDKLTIQLAQAFKKEKPIIERPKNDDDSR